MPRGSLSSSKSAPKKEGISPDKIKLAIAAVVLLAGLGLILYNLGLIGPNPATRPLPPQPVDIQLSPEEQKQVDQAKQKQEEYMKTHPPAGS
ncbi:MAG: hypothetical protein GC200_08465 [Tepidisphaera sp.]|nr:hypothetical protein [Tepidisphaera sp.]